MGTPQSWYDWIEALVAQFGTAKACATFLEIDESKFSRWRRVYFQEPTAMDLERLAARTRTPLPDLLLMVHAALKAREALTALGLVGLSARAREEAPDGE